MDIEPKPESGVNIVNSLSILIVVGYALLMPLWIFYPPKGVSEGILAIINQMMGAWGMAFGTCIAYHLGSSKGTKEAQQTVTALASTAATTAATVANTVAATNGVPKNSDAVAEKPQ